MCPTPLLADPEILELEEITPEREAVTLIIRSTQHASCCPTCQQASERIHSSYRRSPRDLPWQGVPVRLALSVRRFFCTNPSCPQHIFCERLPSVVAPWARQTQRLLAALQVLAFALGGNPGERTSSKLGIQVGRDTLLRRIRQTPTPATVSPRVLGVDDFARRKGASYGTILVDLERHCPVDLLPERAAETLASWLREHPGVTLISRDRAGEYARGSSEGAPEAVQVADRFHLLMNLREALQRLVERYRSTFREVLLPEPSQGDILPAAAQRRPDRRSLAEESARQARQRERRERHDEVHGLKAQGLSILAIARRLGLCRATVYRYLRLDAKAAAERSHHSRSALDPFIPFLHARWQAGCRNASQLWKELQGWGYPGTRRMVDTWVQQHRDSPAPTTPRKYLKTAADITTVRLAAPQTALAPRTLSPRRLAFFLLRAPTSLSVTEQAVLAQLKQRCPELAKAYPLVHGFGRMLRQRLPDMFDSWLECVARSNVQELQAFAAGLMRDETAVRSALSLPWSNGQTEGQITRLKLLKRQMYGRANFDLLRARVLHEA